jgi:hypothetical protein
MKRILTLLGLMGACALGAGASFVLAAPNGSRSGSPSTGKIGICHKTGNSQAHMFIYITPDASGVFNGHGRVTHQDRNDIIPAFSFVTPQGQTISFPGQNLTTLYSGLTGSQLLANQCTRAGHTTTGTTTGHTTTSVTTTGHTTTHPTGHTTTHGTTTAHTTTQVTTTNHTGTTTGHTTTQMTTTNHH